MRAPLEARREPAGIPEQAAKCALYFWTWNEKYCNPCTTYPHRCILAYQYYTSKGFIDIHLLEYPNTLSIFVK